MTAALPRRRPSVWKVVLAGLSGGVVVWWASAWLYAPALRAGVPGAIAMKLPIVGLVLGVLLGAAAMHSAELRTVLGLVVGAPLLCGLAFWLFGLLAGGLLVAFGGSEGVADMVTLVAFWLGVALGAVPLFATVHDRVTTRRAP